MTRPTRAVTRRLPALALAAVLPLSACSVSGDGDKQGGAGDVSTVTLAVHDSWAMPEELIAAFEKDTGLNLEVVPSGDAGQLTNKLVLTKDDPIADVAYGVDNAFVSRALDEGVFADPNYGNQTPVPGAKGHALIGDGNLLLRPVDWSDVCVNVDLAWFREHGKKAPRNLDDLVDPAFKGLFATSSPTSSSPGFAFLLTTLAAYGGDSVGSARGDWRDYWTKLRRNDVRVAAGWTEAYEGDFTAAGKGDRPIVLSYSSSPPFTIPEGGDRPTTRALLGTCFRQVEYAGVLAGSDNPDGAARVLEWLQSREVQAALPDAMYVYPVRDDVELPEVWARWAPAARRPFEVDPAMVAEQRDDLLRDWTDLMQG